MGEFVYEGDEAKRSLHITLFVQPFAQLHEFIGIRNTCLRVSSSIIISTRRMDFMARPRWECAPITLRVARSQAEIDSRGNLVIMREFRRSISRVARD
jgi:hypothetical protein